MPSIIAKITKGPPLSWAKRATQAILRVAFLSFIETYSSLGRNRLINRIKRKALVYCLQASKERSYKALQFMIANRHLRYASALAMTGGRLSAINDEFTLTMRYGNSINDFDFLSPALSHTWFTEGSSQRLQALQRQALSRFPNAMPLAAEFAINCIELGAPNEAIAFIDKHPKKYEIEYQRFLPLAHIVSKNFSWASRHKKYGEVFEKLEENQKGFEDHIRNSSVCIVGNSPIENGRGRGPDIDKHNTVIRFNNFSIEPRYQQDYGSKTNIWVKSCANDVLPRKHLSTLTFILWEQDIWHSEYRWTLPEQLLADTLSGIRVTYIPARTHQELRKITDIQIPSTGLITCFWIYRILGKLDPEAVFGFSMTDQIASNRSKHYFSKHNHRISGMHHNWHRERKILDKMLSGSL